MTIKLLWTCHITFNVQYITQYNTTCFSRWRCEQCNDIFCRACFDFIHARGVKQTHNPVVALSWYTPFMNKAFEELCLVNARRRDLLNMAAAVARQRDVTRVSVFDVCLLIYICVFLIPYSLTLCSNIVACAHQHFHVLNQHTLTFPLISIYKCQLRNNITKIHNIYIYIYMHTCIELCCSCYSEALSRCPDSANRNSEVEETKICTEREMAGP